DVVGCAVRKHILTAAVDQVVAVLYRRHRKNPAGGFDVGNGDFAQSCVPDEALVQQLAHGSELLVARHLWVDPMKLPESDLLDAELPEAGLCLRNEMGRMPV